MANMDALMVERFYIIYMNQRNIKGTVFRT